MSYTVPGISDSDAKALIDGLQERLTDFNDLHLILKHAHWNVVGKNFIAVHEMLDPQIELVRGFADEVAERISTLGGSPLGTPAGHAGEHLDYDVNKAGVEEHLRALDAVYTKVLEGLRSEQKTAGELDAMTEDLYIAEAQALEKFQWFIRAHLDDGDGNIN